MYSQYVLKEIFFFIVFKTSLMCDELKISGCEKCLCYSCGNNPVLHELCLWIHFFETPFKTLQNVIF